MNLEKSRIKKVKKHTNFWNIPIIKSFQNITHGEYIEKNTCFLLKHQFFMTHKKTIFFASDLKTTLQNFGFFQLEEHQNLMKASLLTSIFIKFYWKLLIKNRFKSSREILGQIFNKILWKIRTLFKFLKEILLN